MKKLLAVLLALAMIFSFAACGGEKTQAEAPTTDIVRGGTLNVGKGVLLSTLDPTKATARDSDYDVYVQIYETLIKQDANGSLVPSLAESWEVKDDTTIVFNLRQDVKFHDGTAFNADAVKANFDYFMNEDNAVIFLSELKCVESVEVVSEYVAQINLKYASALFLTDLSNYSGLMIAPSALAEGADYLAVNACGTGPFKVSDYVEGVSLSLVANPDYYVMGEDGKALPYLDGVEIKMLTDQTTKLNAIIAGDVDTTDYLSTTGIETLETNDSITTQRIATSDIYTLFCNINDELMQNKAVRQAIAYAVDREAINNVITRGYGLVSNWACDPNQWFYSDYTPYTKDIEKAKSLLKEAGYENGLEITMTCISREPDNTIMQILQQQLAEVGITLKLEPMERTEWVAMWTKEKAGTLGLAKMTVPRVDAFVQLNTNMGASSANNYSHYEGAEYNELINKVGKTYDVEEQKQILAEAQKVYLEDCFSIFLYQMPRYDSYANYVQGFNTLALGPAYYATMWLAK